MLDVHACDPELYFATFVTTDIHWKHTDRINIVELVS